MTRQEQAVWLFNFLRILAIGLAALGVTAVLYQALRGLLGKKGKLSKKQLRRQARKAAKAGRNADRRG